MLLKFPSRLIQSFKYNTAYNKILVPKIKNVKVSHDLIFETPPLKLHAAYCYILLPYIPKSINY